MSAEHISQLFADRPETEDMKDDIRALYHIVARIEKKIAELEKRIEAIEPIMQPRWRELK